MGVSPQQLPADALKSNQALFEYLDAFLVHELPDNLRIQTIFYLVWKCLLFSTVSIFVVILLKQRRFWLFRVVKVPKGKIICPNACEALLSFASIFYLCDAVFRGLSLQYFFSPTSKQTNLLLFTVLRIVPMWTAGFVHVAAVGLLWPFSPSQMPPLLWHTFLFGSPSAFVISILPTAILSNTALNRANIIFQDLRVHLLASPASAVLPSYLDVVEELSVELKQAYKYARIWACIGAGFLIVLIVMTLVIGPVMMYKINQELLVLKQSDPLTTVSDESCGYVENAEANYTQKSSSSQARSSGSGGGGNEGQEAKGKLGRLFAQIRLPGHNESMGLEQLRGRPTKAARIAVLSDFLAFTAAQVFCLAALEVSILSVVIYFSCTAVKSLDSSTYVPVYKTELQRTIYIYHVVEIWSVIVFGTPLVVLMLYRQCFPTKVEVYEAVHSHRAVKHQSIPDDSRSKPAPEPWASPSTLNDDSSSNGSHRFKPTTSTAGDTARPLSITQKFKASRRGSKADEEPAGLSEQIAREGQEENSSDRVPSMQDACGYIGPGAGRSIVLDALQHANQYPRAARRRASPWHVVSSNASIGSADLEAASVPTAGLNLYATPHGVVEGVPLCNLTRPEEGIKVTPATSPKRSKHQERPTSSPRPRTAESTKSMNLFPSMSRRERQNNP